MQIVDEEDELAFDFDLLDPTKLIPEELVPVQRVGKLTLNRNPDNFFAETEQVAFHVGHVVPGIDFTNDPLLQGRLFSYTDTQLIRLGGPNFHEIPINRPLAPVHNNQRDGFMRQTINRGRASYEPELARRRLPGAGAGGRRRLRHVTPQPIDGREGPRPQRELLRPLQPGDACSSTASPTPEQQHIVEALRFELGKVETAGDPRADGRPSGPDRRRPGAGASPRASASRSSPARRRRRT